MSDLIFDADSADKAARTLEFLESFRSHPDANGKVCLHGGTALNLFVLTPERLSLDADINYIGEGSVPKVGVSIRFWRAGEACPRKTDIV